MHVSAEFLYAINYILYVCTSMYMRDLASKVQVTDIPTSTARRHASSRHHYFLGEGKASRITRRKGQQQQHTGGVCVAGPVLTALISGKQFCPLQIHGLIFLSQ